MAIMSIVGAVFTTGIFQVYRTVGATDDRSIAQGQLSRALMRLDREIRYASYVDATSATRPYVEYEVMNGGTPTAPAGPTQQCVQLRLVSSNGGQLQRRTWTQGDPETQLTSWQPLATGVTSATPFTRIDPTDTLTHLQLRITLTSTSGTTAKQSSITYTALNTNQNSVSVATSGTGLVADEPCYTAGTRS
jgi:hypothetical protein